MKTIKAAVVLTALLPCIGCSKAPLTAAELVGEVVDQHGMPVSGAHVGFHWTVYQSNPESGAETSVDGRFRLPIPASMTKVDYPRALLVLHTGRQLGCLKSVGEEEVSKPQRFVLEPVTQVTIKWKLDALPKNEGKGSFRLGADYGGYFMSSAWKRDDVVLMLPSGKYSFSMNASWEKGFTQGVWDFTVVRGAREMLVGPLELKWIQRSTTW